MDPIVSAAGTALVSAMATEAWEQARTVMTTLWRRFRPDQADETAAELETLRSDVLSAREHDDHDTEVALTGLWRLRLQQLLADDPAAADDLRRLLDEHLTPALSPGEQDRVRSVVMKAEARDNARVYMAGRDQHITGS